jgi:hypothetical protein
MGGVLLKYCGKNDKVQPSSPQKVSDFIAYFER